MRTSRDKCSKLISPTRFRTIFFGMYFFGLLTLTVTFCSPMVSRNDTLTAKVPASRDHVTASRAPPRPHRLPTSHHPWSPNMHIHRHPSPPQTQAAIRPEGPCQKHSGHSSHVGLCVVSSRNACCFFPNTYDMHYIAFTQVHSPSILVAFLRYIITMHSVVHIIRYHSQQVTL